MTKPKRIQRSRKKGHKHPPGTLFITRPGPFGNPFTPAGCRAAGYSGTDEEIRKRCVGAFRAWLTSPHWRENWDGPESEMRRAWILANLHKIREATHVACWCKPGSPCHGPVLIELACEGVG